jgi:hypothetical protein
MRKTGLVVAATAAMYCMDTAGAEARSCSDVLNSCMKMFGSGVVHGNQAPHEGEAGCRNDYNSCMQTGTWAGKARTIKGLEKK